MIDLAGPFFTEHCAYEAGRLNCETEPTALLVVIVAGAFLLVAAWIVRSRSG